MRKNRKDKNRANPIDARGLILAGTPGVQCLREAREEAQALRQDVWSNAVETDTLLKLGLTKHDLCSLILRGLAQHAVDRTRITDKRRRLCEIKTSIIPDGAFFVLTLAGYELVTRLVPGLAANGALVAGSPESPTTAPPAAHPEAQTPPSRLVPFWNKELHELWLGDILVKRFTQPAPLQERILTEFQEMGWPPLIQDPLPRTDQDAVDRLHRAVRHLNSAQHRHLVRFFVNGGGQTIHWELTAA